MGSITSEFAKEYRLKEWAGLIKKCQNRPKGMKVIDWCRERNISKDTYYYWFTKVRKECLDSVGISNELAETSIVPVPCDLVGTTKCTGSYSSSVDISVGDLTIHVNDSTSPELLAMVLKVSANV